MTLCHRDQRSEVRGRRSNIRLTSHLSPREQPTRRAVVPRLRDEGGLAEQLFDAVDQATYQKRFHEVLYVVLV